MDEIIQVGVKFKIGGSLRYLSHAQTLSLFQRACVRAAINVQYSEGMNPHPKISLPLPRPVSVESDDELLALKVHTDSGFIDDNLFCTQIKQALSGQLPAGCELTSVDIAGSKESFQPISAMYVIPLRAEYISEKLKTTIENLSERKNIIIHRRIFKKNSRSSKKNTDVKIVDVRRFLESIELKGTNIIAICKITPEGTIQPREIMELLNIGLKELGAPVKRTNVKWQENSGE